MKLKQIKREKGPDPETGKMQYEVITLSKAETVIYEFLEEIREAIKK